MKNGLALQFDPETLRPLIREIVQEVIAQLADAQAKVSNGQLCYSEAEAARLLGLDERQLADERRRGRIPASQIVCNRIRYTREDLIAYLAGRRWTPA